MNTTFEATAAASVKIARFAQETGDGPAAVERLRAELEAAGGPLVEPVEGDSRTVLVSFVWIGSDRPVSVQSALTGLLAPVPMSRVSGTDVWYLSSEARADLTTSYQFWIDERAYADPFNPDPQPVITAASAEQWLSVLTLPAAEPMHWFDSPADSPGSLEGHQFTSTTMGNERTVTVYTPPGYRPDSGPYPLVVMLDGEMWTNAAAPQHIVFDNLIAAERIPPVVVAFVDNPPSDLPLGATRAFEMDCNPDYPTMLADELLPMLHARYAVASDPARVVIAGPSFGGLAAAYIGYERPEVFGNVLACSPAVWWGYANDGERFTFDPDGNPRWLQGVAEEPEWLIRQYAAAEHKPLRFWVDVGCLEVAPLMPIPSTGLDYRAAVAFRTVLIAKGYDITYYEAPGGHDWPTFRRSYVKGLQTLLAS